MSNLPDDGPFIDLNVFAAHGNINWDSRIYNGQDIGGGNHAGTYLYGAFSSSVLGFAAQYSARWWDRDFGDGGLYDITVIHVTGFDVGIYSIRVDDLEVARLDGYSLTDVNNIFVKVARLVPISPGPHRISIVIPNASPFATGLKFYPAIQGLSLSKVGAYQPRGVRGGGSPRTRKGPVIFGRTIDICPLFATGNTNWSNLLLTNAMWYGFEMYSTGVQNAARWWDITLDAGQWDMEIRCATFNAAGIINVQLDGVTVSTIDTYSGTTVYGVQKIVRFTVASPGIHTLKFLMATKNGLSSQYYGDISGIQLRQVPVRHLPVPLWPALVWRPMFMATGQSGWPDSGFVISPSYAFTGEAESGGTQGASRWWDVTLAAGTYTFEMWHSTGNNRGIYSVRLDGREVGTIDGYSSGVVLNLKASVTGIIVPSNGHHRLSLVMATKNSSSGSYFGTATLFAMRRTGA